VAFAATATLVGEDRLPLRCAEAVVVDALSPCRFHLPMQRRQTFFAALLAIHSASASGCKPSATDKESGRTGSAGPATVLADTGFRPAKDGYKFENQGGHYPRTPPVLTAPDVAKMFGNDVCASGTGTTCRLKPVATEWMSMVNRAMNEGQCEGMAVSSLAFYKHLYQPSAFAAHAKSAHDLTHAETASLIGYFWAYQTVNPVRSDKVQSLRSMTPISAEERLIEMMKRNELAVIAIRSPHGGHAVTPYSVEDRGEGIHWINIYDNNWPDKDRHIVIDHNANTWAYELASLNPDIPREPWSGDADSHSIAVTPLSDRLAKAECPFCAGGKKMVVSYGANGVTLTNAEGKKLGRDPASGKIVNEIPGAEVLEVASYIDGAPASEPIYVVPSDGDYQVAIARREKPAKAETAEDEHGIAVIGNGAAVTVETPKLEASEKHTLSVGHDGGIKYKTGRPGEFPAIRLAADGANGGMHARLSHMNAEANDELEVKMDHAAGQIAIAGGGKKASAFDLKVTHVTATGEDKVNEQKGIKFVPGLTHTIQSSATAPLGAVFKVATHKTPPPPPASAPPLPSGAAAGSATPSATPPASPPAKGVFPPHPAPAAPPRGVAPPTPKPH
jgi:hypothetical protein